MAEGNVVSTETKSWVPASESANKRGVAVKRLFTKVGVHPFDELEWELRTASIQNEKGRVIFEQRDVEVPKDWTQTATNIVASKYFHGKVGTPDRESSVRQLIARVADTIAQWGRRRRSIPPSGSTAASGTNTTAMPRVAAGTGTRPRAA